MYYAIKITPKYKRIFCVLSLLPIFLQQAMGVSNDYITNAISFMIIALILKYKFENKTISLNQVLIVIALGIIISLCKFGYFFVLLLIWIVPNEKFKNKKIAITLKILIVLIPLLIALIVNAVTINNTNSNENKYNIGMAISDPINVAKMYIRTFFDRFYRDILFEVVDRFRWSSKVHKSIILYTIVSIHVIIILINDEEDKINLNLIDRFILLMSFFIVYSVIYMAGYTWTLVGDKVISGIQSRYCLPILPLFYISISNNMLKLNVKNKYRFYIILLSVVQVISASSILIGFY